jgi:P27 family predicted phage terminase small subunit
MPALSGAPEMPDYLAAAGRAEWLRVMPQLLKAGMVNGLDANMLGLWCQSAGRLKDLEAAFNDAVAKLVEGGMTYTEATLKTSTAVTPSGYEQSSVLVQLISKHRAEVARYGAVLGLNPTSRLRVVVQDSAPEMPASGSGFARFVN